MLPEQSLSLMSHAVTDKHPVTVRKNEGGLLCR